MGLLKRLQKATYLNPANSDEVLIARADEGCDVDGELFYDCVEVRKAACDNIEVFRINYTGLSIHI
jgi:hypothetical protein